jgi:hypothetical protein
MQMSISRAQSRRSTANKHDFDVPFAPQYLAHVRRNDDGSFVVHELEEHLRAVGDRAGEFALSLGCQKFKLLSLSKSDMKRTEQ